jgi:adenosylmethionine-8-amino-7-oxononanoate aminotransferase
MGEKLQRRLQETFAAHQHVAEVRGRGLLQAIEIVANRETLETFPEAANLSGQIVSEALKRGVFFYGGGTGSVRDIICLGPPFIVEESHIEQMCGTLAESVDAVIARLASR